MAEIDVYCNLPDDKAIDPEGRNISHPRLRAMHLQRVPLLAVLGVTHLSYENSESDRLVLRRGQIVVHKGMRATFRKLFEGWLELGYPIEQAVPISQFPDSSDAISMAKNNTVAYRPDVIGDADDPLATPSEHYRGTAIDVNPWHNPLINADHTIEPREAIGHLPRLGMMLRRQVFDVVKYAIDDCDLEWGGDWADPRAGAGYYGIGPNGQQRHMVTDTHHFELIPHLAARFPMPEL